MNQTLDSLRRNPCYDGLSDATSLPDRRVWKTLGGRNPCYDGLSDATTRIIMHSMILTLSQSLL